MFKAALLHDRWLRHTVTLVVSLLGGGFAILCHGQVGSAAVEASGTEQKVEFPAAQPPQVLPKEPVTDTAPSRTASPQLAAGSTYLQLSATRRQDAELMIEHLRRKNFEAVALEIERRPGVFRVLVGPVEDRGVLELRANLERAGFHGNAAVRRISAKSKRPKSDNAVSDQVAKEDANNSTSSGIFLMRPHLDSADLLGAAEIQRIPTGSDPTNPDVVKSSSNGSTKTDTGSRSGDGQTCLEFDATSPQTAGIIAHALREKGFEVITSQIEEAPGEFRVLVRPAKDASIDQLRVDLERAGFHGNAATLRLLK